MAGSLRLITGVNHDGLSIPLCRGTNSRQRQFSLRGDKLRFVRRDRLQRISRLNLEGAIAPDQLSESEWLLVRDAMELSNSGWDDENVLGLGLTRILRHLIHADLVYIGCTEVDSGVHRTISLDGVSDSGPAARAVLQRKVALVAKALVHSEQATRNGAAKEGYPYSDLARPLVLDAALGVIVPVWSCSMLVDILVTPAQRDQFSDAQREMLNLLITHIAEAFRRVWTSPSFSPGARFHSTLSPRMTGFQL
jgi:hypothetical protein